MKRFIENASPKRFRNGSTDQRLTVLCERNYAFSKRFPKRFIGDV